LEVIGTSKNPNKKDVIEILHTWHKTK
jgi:hypothetical protein